MIINVFSDSHLTHRFRQEKFDKIKHIIETCDQVIINGDFWDYYRTTFDKFLASRYSELFPLLKAKNCIYVYGNHDRQPYSDERVYRFCTQAVQNYTLKTRYVTYYLDHGSEMAPIPDFGIGIEGKFDKASKLPLYFIQYVGHAFFHDLFFKYVYKPFNRKIKEWRAKNLDNDVFLVTGHTHFCEIDFSTRFANAGLNHYGEYQHLQINTEEPIPNNIQLVHI